VGVGFTWLRGCIVTGCAALPDGPHDHPCRLEPRARRWWLPCVPLSWARGHPLKSAVSRPGQPHVLCKPRADTGQPVRVAVCRVLCARSKALDARASHLPARGHRPASRRLPVVRHPSRRPCPRPRHRDAGHVTSMLDVFSDRVISRCIVLCEQYPLRDLTYHKGHSSILRSSDSLKVLTLWSSSS
jgi:hypothetical protein